MRTVLEVKHITKYNKWYSSPKRRRREMQSRVTYGKSARTVKKNAWKPKDSIIDFVRKISPKSVLYAKPRGKLHLYGYHYHKKNLKELGEG